MPPAPYYRQTLRAPEGTMEQDKDGVWRLQVPRTGSRALVKTGIWASKASDTDLKSLPPEVLQRMEDIFNKSGDRCDQLHLLCHAHR
eukprot:scaffold217205_cov24-Prasinocladus_malaysianus.AAC.1